MRKLILKMSMTVDGFVALPDGKQPWIQRTGIDDKQSAAWTLDAIRGAGAHVMGSRTFRDMASYWPYSTEVFAAPMNSIPKVVFTHEHTIDPEVTKPAPNAQGKHASPEALASWREARIASGPLADEIAALKQESGGPLIAYGGASFAQSLVRAGLADELDLLVHPIAIGRGMPLFSTLTEPMQLEVVDVKRFPLGAVAHVYRKPA
jgi:dihydrofolate reductase